MQVDRGRGEDPVEQGISEERSHLVLNRGDAVGTVAEGEALELLLQESADRFVAHGLRYGPPVTLAGENAQDVLKRCIRLFEQRHKNVAQDVLHPHAPGQRPELFKDLHHARGSKRNPGRTDVAERVVTVGLRRIGCVQVENLISPPRRNAFCDALHEITVRIDERKPVAKREILARHRFQQSRLAGTGLPNDVDVREAIVFLDAEDARVSSEIDSRKSNGRALPR